MVKAHINSKRPKYQVTAQATSTSVANALVRSYTWGLDAGGSMQGAGGVGGLLMVNAGSGGVHFPAYDLNGNVMGLVNAADGMISAKYEYGPFGEVFCSVGDMAKVNPFQFSTKYTDNETDLLYYGYRYYSPALGRWLSRDPIEEQGGLNLYGFVNNDPVNKWDVLGLWDEYIHYKMTQKWAKSVGYKEKFAKHIALANEAVDYGPMGPLPGENQSYHFNRPWSDFNDSRLNHHDRHMELAKNFCTPPNDFPGKATSELGKALHPLQDWVAHGDYGFGNLMVIITPHGGLDYKKVDNPLYDNIADPLNGRPVKIIRKNLAAMSGPTFQTYYIPGYIKGRKRFDLTKNITINSLKEFRSHVRYFGGPCCREIFLQ